MTTGTIKLLFTIAGVYDLVIGLVFLFAGGALLDGAGIPRPSHMGYLHFAALQLVIFGTMFFAIVRAPLANRNLIPFGIMLKVFYVGIVMFYWSQGDCPLLFKPFAGIDAVMLVGFVLAWRTLKGRGAEGGVT